MGRPRAGGPGPGRERASGPRGGLLPPLARHGVAVAYQQRRTLPAPVLRPSAASLIVGVSSLSPSLRYNSDAFYDEEATGIIAEQCNDMLGD